MAATFTFLTESQNKAALHDNYLALGIEIFDSSATSNCLKLARETSGNTTSPLPIYVDWIFDRLYSPHENIYGMPWS